MILSIPERSERDLASQIYISVTLFCSFSNENECRMLEL